MEGKKKIYGKWLLFLRQTVGIDKAKQIDAFIRYKKKLNLRHPQTLSDKVAYIELHKQSPLASQCSDKFEVRNYVKQKGLENILLPIYHNAVDDVNKIAFESLPDKFILKATHGCRMNIPVADKTTLNIEQCKSKMRQWLNTKYGTYSLEPHYEKIKPRIYAEHLIEDIDGLTDYKIHCLNGVPQFILVCYGRQDTKGKSMAVNLSLFDTEWNYIDAIVPFKNDHKGTPHLPKPDSLTKMLEVSKILSEDFRFVRVDLYERNGNVLFGELTFTPTSCVFAYFSDEFNMRMGNKLQI